tara:strand:+ start:558 stop:692 length:135 start_codon:yes stop_codon:yes gene_type:complete
LVFDLYENREKIAEITNQFTRRTFQLDHGDTYDEGGPGKKKNCC